MIAPGTGQILVSSNPIARLNFTTTFNSTTNITNTPSPTMTQTATSGPTISDDYDVAELFCKTNSQTLKVFDCEVIGIVQLDPANKDQIRSVENAIGSINIIGNLPINTTTFLPIK